MLFLLSILLTLTTALNIPKKIVNVYDSVAVSQFPFDDSDFNANAATQFQITDYGNQILQNKLMITNTMLQMQLSFQDQALIMAMAMMETVSLSSNDRDKSKDGTSSENVSQWNLSVGLVETVSPGTNPQSLNNDIGATIQVILKGLNYYGLATYLNAVRGGGTAIADGVSYGIYKNTYFVL